MTVQLVKPGATKFHASCHDCGAQFTYERSDVRENFMRGGRWVHCPHCHEPYQHHGDWHAADTPRRRW